jgi:molybdopterin synthase sulfur carrier subunit
MPRLRLFATLREAAGTASTDIPGNTVAEVLSQATLRFGPDFSRALVTAQTWVNGERAGPATPVTEGDEIALIPPVSGGTTVVRSPAGLEAALLIGVTAALFVGNAISIRWFCVAVVLTGTLWGYDLASGAGRRGLEVGAVPVVLSVAAGALATYRFGLPGMAASTVGAGLLALVWSIVTPRLRPLESVAGGVLVSVVASFGAAAMVLLRIPLATGESATTSFLLVVTVSVAAAWVAAATDVAPIDPLTAGVLAALGAGVLAGAVWSEDLWPTVVAAAAAAAAMVAGRNLGSLARFGGFFLSGSSQGSLVHLDGVLPAAGAFWLALHLLA